MKLPIIDHHYIVPYVPIYNFEWTQPNKIVSLITYEPIIMTQLKEITDHLIEKPHSRQDVITVNSKTHNSCLLSIQFQIDNSTLHAIFNYRSQCEKLGRPHDERMMKYLCTLVKDKLALDYVSIHVNVGNYHINPYFQELSKN